LVPAFEGQRRCVVRRENEGAKFIPEEWHLF
jgi:hypothetical protein